MVTFCLPNQGARMFKETVEASNWFDAKAMLQGRYQGIVIKNYTIIK
jgi:hypothetical protein